MDQARDARDARSAASSTFQRPAIRISSSDTAPPLTGRETTTQMNKRTGLSVQIITARAKTPRRAAFNN